MEQDHTSNNQNTNTSSASNRAHQMATITNVVNVLALIIPMLDTLKSIDDPNRTKIYERWVVDLNFKNECKKVLINTLSRLAINEGNPLELLHNDHELFLISITLFKLLTDYIPKNKSVRIDYNKTESCKIDGASEKSIDPENDTALNELIDHLLAFYFEQAPLNIILTKEDVQTLELADKNRLNTYKIHAHLSVKESEYLIHYFTLATLSKETALVKKLRPIILEKDLLDKIKIEFETNDQNTKRISLINALFTIGVDDNDTELVSSLLASSKNIDANDKQIAVTYALNNPHLDKLAAVIIDNKWGSFVVTNPTLKLSGNRTLTYFDLSIDSLDYRSTTTNFDTFARLTSLLIAAGAKSPNIESDFHFKNSSDDKRKQFAPRASLIMLGHYLDELEDHAKQQSDERKKTFLLEQAKLLRKEVPNMIKSNSDKTFQTALKSLLDNPIIKNDKKLKVILINIGLCIAGLVVGYIAAGLVHLAVTRGKHFAFFTESKEQKLCNKIDKQAAEFIQLKSFN